MKQYSQYIIYTLLLLLVIGCDEGKIFPEEDVYTGRSAIVTVSFSGLQAWPKDNMLGLCTFGENLNKPLQLQRIRNPRTENLQKTFTIDNITPDTKYIGIAVVSGGLKVIYAYNRFPVDNSDQDINLEMGTLVMGSFKRIQAQVFDKACLSCHGESDRIAGHLDLKTEVAYKSLVNVKAPLSKEGKNYITPGDVNNSFMLDILRDDKYHKDMFNSSGKKEILDLIEAWINGGALNN